MSILVKEDTRVLVQGITGDFGARHARLSIDYGSQIVAGVTPGKGGQTFEHGGKKVPIFNTVADAARQTGATVSAIFVPPPFAADAILECVDADLDLAVAITEGIPVRDMVRAKRAMQGRRTRLIGPNCPGLVTPGRGDKSHGGCRIGIAPGYIHRRGNVGVVSRSGTLTSAVASPSAGSMALRSEDLPTPLWPLTAVWRPARSWRSCVIPCPVRMLAGTTMQPARAKARRLGRMV